MTRNCAIVGRDRNHASSGKVATLVFELSGSAGAPITAEEKNNGGATFVVFVFGRTKDVHLEFDVAHLFVDFRISARHLRRIVQRGLRRRIFRQHC